MSAGTGRQGEARAEVEGVSVPLDHYINGRRVGSPQRFAVHSPIDWDNWELGRVSAGGRAEVDLAVVAARNAFPGWAALGPAARLEVLARLADAVDGAVADLAKVECADNGSLHEAMRLRVLPRAANNIRFFAQYAVDDLGERALAPCTAASATVCAMTPAAWSPSPLPGTRRSCSRPGASVRRWRRATRSCPKHPSGLRSPARCWVTWPRRPGSHPG